MSIDMLATNCDQRVSMVQCCFTSTETIRGIRTGSPGRSPRLSQKTCFVATGHVFVATVHVFVATKIYLWQLPPVMANSVGRQMRGHKECHFGDVINSSSFWRNLPESEARKKRALRDMRL